MFRVGSVALLAVWLCSFVAGCEKKPEDHVLAQYKRGEDAIAMIQPEEYRNIISTESGLLYEEILKQAKRATPEQTKKLPATVMEAVLALRNRMTPTQLRELTQDRLLRWMMDEGVLVVDADSGIYPMSVKIEGETAEIQMGIEVEKQRSFRMGRRMRRNVTSAVITLVAPRNLEAIPGLVYKMVMLNGHWYFDSMASSKEYDEVMVREAASAKVPLHELLASLEEESYGSLKEDVWSPPSKK